MIPAVLCSHWYAASPEVIFRAFTEPDLLERWFSPMPEVMRVETCDPRPGGVYRFVYNFPGSPKSVTGEYQIVTPPSRLIFTWTWEPPDPDAGVITLVTIDLTAENGGTHVSVRHEHFTTPEMRSNHESGWASTLPRLAALCPASH